MESTSESVATPFIRRYPTVYLLFLSIFSWASAMFLGWSIEPFAATMVFDTENGTLERWTLFPSFQFGAGLVAGSCFLWFYFLFFTTYSILQRILPLVVLGISSVVVFLCSACFIADSLTASHFFHWTISTNSIVPAIVSKSGWVSFFSIILGIGLGTYLGRLMNPRTVLGNNQEKESLINLSNCNFDRVTKIGSVAVLLAAGIAVGCLLFAEKAKISGLYCYVCFFCGCLLGLFGSSFLNFFSKAKSRGARILVSSVCFALVSCLSIFWMVSSLPLLERLQHQGNLLFVLGFLLTAAIANFVMSLVRYYPIFLFTRPEIQKTGSDLIQDKEGLSVARVVLENQDYSEEQVSGSFTWLVGIPVWIAFLYIGLSIPKYYSVGAFLATGNEKFAQKLADLRSYNDGKSAFVCNSIPDEKSESPVPLVFYKDSGNYIENLKGGFLFFECAPAVEKFLENGSSSDAGKLIEKELNEISEAAKGVSGSAKLLSRSEKPNGLVYPVLVKYLAKPPIFVPTDLNTEQLRILLESGAFPPFAKIQHVELKPGMEKIMGRVEFEYFDCQFDPKYELETYYRERVRNGFHLWDNCELSEEQWRRAISLGRENLVNLFVNTEESRFKTLDLDLLSELISRFSVTYYSSGLPTPFINAKGEWDHSSRVKTAETKRELPSLLRSNLIETDSDGNLIGFDYANLNWTEHSKNRLDPGKIEWVVSSLPSDSGDRNWASNKLLAGELTNLKNLSLSVSREDSFGEHAEIDTVIEAIKKASQLSVLELDGSVSEEFLKKSKNSHVQTLVVGSLKDQKEALKALSEWSNLKELVICQPKDIPRMKRKPRRPSGGGMPAISGPPQRFDQSSAAAFASKFLDQPVKFRVTICGFSDKRMAGNSWVNFRDDAKFFHCVKADVTKSESKDGSQDENAGEKKKPSEEAKPVTKANSTGRKKGKQ